MHKSGILFIGLTFGAGFFSAWLCMLAPRGKSKLVLGLATVPPDSRAQAIPAHAAALVSDPLETTICSHLQSLAQAIQAGGVKMTPQRRPKNRIRIHANCRVNLKELARRYGPATQLYEERCFIDRSGWGPDGAYFSCATCLSGLAVVHPGESETDTPLVSSGFRAPRGQLRGMREPRIPAREPRAKKLSVDGCSFGNPYARSFDRLQLGSKDPNSSSHDAAQQH